MGQKAINPYIITKGLWMSRPYITSKCHSIFHLECRVTVEMHSWKQRRIVAVTRLRVLVVEEAEVKWWRNVDPAADLRRLADVEGVGSLVLGEDGEIRSNIHGDASRSSWSKHSIKRRSNIRFVAVLM